METNDGSASLVRSDALLARIEQLRDEWAFQAWGIERTHGDDDPGGKAIRGCIGDLARAVEEVRTANASFTLRGEAKRNPDSGERSCSTC